MNYKISFLAFIICACVLTPNLFAQKSKPVGQTGRGKKLIVKTAAVRRNQSATLSVRPATPAEVLQFVHQTAVAYGIPPKLYESLLRVEGGGICNLSPKGARGLSQMMPGTARRFGLRVDASVDERCDVYKAVVGGAKYLGWLLNYFSGDVALALAGYNAGEGAVLKYNRLIPPYRETTQYVEKIGYLYTGQPGLALSRAYNLPTANRLIAPIYSSRASYQARPLQIQITPNVRTPSLSDSPPPDSVSTSPVADQTVVENKPTTVRKVPVEIESRINTSSLFYWNNR